MILLIYYKLLLLLHIHISNASICLDTIFDNAKSRLITCFSDIQAWCVSMCLKPNASKTKLIWFNRHPTSTTDMLHTVLNLGPDCSMKPADVVRDLGVLLNNTLSLKYQIDLSSVIKSFFFYLRRIWQVRQRLAEKCLRTLVQALVISRLEYCNSVLYRLYAYTL